MAHSGKFKPKNITKYKGDYTKITYRSGWELRCFKWCDDSPMVKYWSSEEVVIPYMYDVDKRMHRYFMDLKITWKDGSVDLIEIKPDKETRPPEYKGKKTKRYINESLTYIKNQNKWTTARSYAKDRDWGFQIWTEHTLEKMGLMPKKTKPLKSAKVALKPLKPLKVKKRTKK